MRTRAAKTREEEKTQSVESSENDRETNAQLEKWKKRVEEDKKRKTSVRDKVLRYVG